MNIKMLAKVTNWQSLKHNYGARLLLRHMCGDVEPEIIEDQISENSFFDLVIVGGGIIGVTTAREVLLHRPNMKIALVEKEPRLAMHQTGHNSGVIHSGMYYKPGSLKALLCVAGLHATYKFCNEHNIPYKKCGKIIVATDISEFQTLEYIYKQGIANDVPDIKIICSDEIKKLEPHCQGLKAVYSPHTGIVDWVLVTKYCAKEFQTRGGKIYCNYEVTAFTEVESGTEKADVSSYPIKICGKKHNYSIPNCNDEFALLRGQVIRAKNVVTCGGLYADKLAEMTYMDSNPKIIPFRGEYLLLSKEKSYLVNGNIYPVPDPKLPFLGVHFTPRLNGDVWIGPSALLAFKREGYRWTDINWKELLETLTYPGFIKLAINYKSHGYQEIMKSIFLSRKVKELQKYIPEITINDVSRGPSGVRAQAMTREGDFVDGFEFHAGKSGIEKNIIHCRNAPSPAATSCLPIARYIYEHVKNELES